jgi:antitoxin component YwqK of YwqJK toxin-antitoxin module
MAKKLHFFSLAGLTALSIVLSACSGPSNYMDEYVLDETYVHRYGMEVPQDFWQSSGEHGNVISTMSDGVVISRSYSSGMLDGDTTYTYPHSSQIQKCESYRSGALAKETEYFYDGTPKYQTEFQPNNRQLATAWYLTGNPKSIETYDDGRLEAGEYFTAINQRDTLVSDGQGIRLSRDDYGQLLSTDKIENGQMVLCQTYHPNGSPKEMVPYRNGQIDGVKRTYQPAGEPDTIEQWVAGKQEGLSLVYQHGEKFAEVPYVNGEKHGVECRYRDGSSKVQEISWHSGQMSGPSTTYVGDSTKTEWYYQGKPVSKADYEFISNRPMVR